ncbi:WXG100 family type VII secretion target [Kibdelosporangium aridum]|uniref:Outer membrane channel protein CpnT-like N-terminal domain-containing protein n=1 Tax=Kibdelosporangium aridum TaxID=2030 RepID=A0A1Y5X5P0_KIBAR|nr:hypothetical protein [Kibdelosporangium aridum]SMC72584.1 hypothetical protein SAMN05661093_01707 [Kibdelosporangium aridum]
MTGFGVDGAQLLAHGQGSIKQSENFAGLEKLLEQARVSDDCFGPLFFYFKDKYFESLMECQTMAKQAGTYLQQISDSVTQTAEAYGATEANNKAGLADVGNGVGDLGDLNSAGDSTRKGYWDQVGAYGSSWSKAKQDVTAQLKDPGSPPEAAFAAFNARMEQLKAVASPGQSLVDNGLGWLISIVISPIVNYILEPAIGDPEQMRSTAKGWENVADWLKGVGDAEDKRSQATAAIWEGEAAEKFRAEMKEFGDGTRAMSGDISNLKGILETAATIFDTFVEVCIDIIQELVLGLIIEWLAALAASWITAGASVAAASAMTAGQVTITGSRLAKKINDLRKKLAQLINKLEEIIKALRNGKVLKNVPFLKKYADDVPKTIDKMSEKRGTFAIGGQIKGNPVTNLASSTDNMNDARKALDKAEDVLAKTDPADKKKYDAAEQAVKDAQQKVVNATDRRTVSTNRWVKTKAHGDEALAQGLIKTTLGYLAGGGTTNTTKAVFSGVLENVPGAAVEWGAGQAYDHAQDPSTDEERKAAQQRGFTTDDGTAKNP